MCVLRIQEWNRVDEKCLQCYHLDGEKTAAYVLVSKEGKQILHYGGVMEPGSTLFVQLPSHP